MIKSLTIEKYRCFSFFELKQLGRVNLLVGRNNSGKTSVLEAIHLLYSSNILDAFHEILASRGEYIGNEEIEKNREYDFSHLFYNHDIGLGTFFSIGADDQRKLSVSIAPKIKDEEFTSNIQEIGLRMEWNFPKSDPTQSEPISIELPLSKKGGIPVDNFLRLQIKEINKYGVKTQLVMSSYLTPSKMIELFDKFVLTPEERVITEALKIIEPNIERLASVGSERYRYLGSRGGFKVLLADSRQPIPIGSLGDGIWRMLGLTLAMVNAKGGILLIDEIDTGLHFTTLSDMWKLIWETAKKLDIQVFATTHNSDCWTSLAEIANAESPHEDGITIQRIEKGKSQSIVFTERQIAIAAERGIEVR